MNRVQVAKPMTAQLLIVGFQWVLAVGLVLVLGAVAVLVVASGRAVGFGAVVSSFVPAFFFSCTAFGFTVGTSVGYALRRSVIARAERDRGPDSVAWAPASRYRSAWSVQPGSLVLDPHELRFVHRDGRVERWPLPVRATHRFGRVALQVEGGTVEFAVADGAGWAREIAAA